MLRVLTKEDMKLVVELYRTINRFDESTIANLYETLNVSKILCANIENGIITSLLMTNIIKNNYYLEEVIFLTNNIEEIKELITYTVMILRNDERGLNIIYDNFPYNELMHQIMTENGFKCNFMNFVCENDLEKAELISPRIRLNDKDNDVKEYIYKNYINELKSNNLYLGISSDMPDIECIHLENTNIAVIRDNDNKVVGTARFGLIGNSICLYSLYADNHDIYKELLSLVKNLTNKQIEVGVLPVRENLVQLLKMLDFKIFQADYILKLN